MVNSIEGAAEAIEGSYKSRSVVQWGHNFYGKSLKLKTRISENGTTVAIVRHPFLRLYSAWKGFFTQKALPRDYSFGKFWLKNSDAFAVIMQKHPNIRERLTEVDLDYQSGPQVQLMNFSQFIEGIVLHAQKAQVATILSRWE